MSEIMQEAVKAVPRKMKIMVSACLSGEKCKYNGGNNRNQELLNLLSGLDEPGLNMEVDQS